MVYLIRCRHFRKNVLCSFMYALFYFYSLHKTQRHYGLFKPSRGKSHPYHATYLCTLNVETEALLAWDFTFDYDNIKCITIRLCLHYLISASYSQCLACVLENKAKKHRCVFDITGSLYPIVYWYGSVSLAFICLVFLQINKEWNEHLCSYWSGPLRVGYLPP